jgi:hypothetical protein
VRSQQRRAGKGQAEVQFIKLCDKTAGGRPLQYLLPVCGGRNLLTPGACCIIQCNRTHHSAIKLAPAIDGGASGGGGGGLRALLINRPADL